MLQGRTDEAAARPARTSGRTEFRRAEGAIAMHVADRLPRLIDAVGTLHRELRRERTPGAGAGRNIHRRIEIVVVMNIEALAGVAVIRKRRDAAIFRAVTWTREASIEIAVFPPLRLKARLDHHFQEV